MKTARKNIEKQRSLSRIMAAKGNAVYAGMVFILGMYLSVVAGIPSVHTNMLFLHSHFKGKHWDLAGDTLDYNLTSGFTTLTPVKVSIAGNDTNNILLFSTSTNKLYLMHALLEPPPTFTSYPKMTVDNPVESPVGTSSDPFGVFAYTSDNLDIVFCAIATAANKVAVHHMVGGAYTVFKTDTLTVALPSPNCQITKLYGGPDLAKGSQSCIWAVGTHGLIRFFAWNGSAWSAETVYDIDTTETVTAFSLAAVGTRSGKVYQEQSGGFVYNSQPTTTPINSINANGAACNSGVVLKKKGNQWTKFTAGSADYHYFNFIPRTDGAGVELLSDSWQFLKYTLEDTPTFYDILPESVANYINSGVYQYDGFSQETITINLIDPDGNCLVPQIVVEGQLLIVDSSDTLRSMHPDTACVPGFIELADTTMTLLLKENSVEFKVKARTAAFNPTSFKYYWQYPAFETSVAWQYYDNMSIVLGNQTLQIQYAEGTTIVSHDTKSKGMPQAVIHHTAHGLIFTLTQNTIRAIRIFNSAGQKLADVNPSPGSKRIAVPLWVSSGIVCVEYLHKNGTVLRTVIPVVK